MFSEDENVTENQAMAQLKSLEKDIVRTAILKDKKELMVEDCLMSDKLNVKLVYYQERMVQLCLQEVKHKP